MDQVDGGCQVSAAGALLDPAQAGRLAEVFKALGDPHRVQLVRFLAAEQGGAVCACHLPDALGISQPTVSHHLKKLVAAGILVREQWGRWAHFSVEPGVLDLVTTFLRESSERCRPV